MEWMILPIRRYADFQGRSRRMEYWMFFLFCIIVGVVTGIIDGLLGFGEFSSTSGASGFESSFRSNGPFNIISSLVLLIPGIAVAVRRLHDSDRSGWWLLLWLIPILGWIVLIVFYCLDGTPGPNRFGPDPKDPSGGMDDQSVFG